MKAKIKILDGPKIADHKTTKQEKEILKKQLSKDVKNSAIVLSVVLNAYLIIGIAVIQATNRYDVAIISFLQNN